LPLGKKRRGALWESGDWDGLRKRKKGKKAEIAMEGGVLHKEGKVETIRKKKKKEKKKA